MASVSAEGVKRFGGAGVRQHGRVPRLGSIRGGLAAAQPSSLGSEDGVAGGERLQAGELDLQVGGKISGDVGLDEGVTATLVPAHLASERPWAAGSPHPARVTGRRAEEYCTITVKNDTLKTPLVFDPGERWEAPRRNLLAKSDRHAPGYGEQGCAALRRKPKGEEHELTVVPRAGRFHLIQAAVDALDEAVDDESVDGIDTDPPYPREYLPVYGQRRVPGLARRRIRPASAGPCPSRPSCGQVDHRVGCGLIAHLPKAPLTRGDRFGWAARTSKGDPARSTGCQPRRISSMLACARWRHSRAPCGSASTAWRSSGSASRHVPIVANTSPASRTISGSYQRSPVSAANCGPPQKRAGALGLVMAKVGSGLHASSVGTAKRAPLAR